MLLLESVDDGSRNAQTKRTCGITLVPHYLLQVRARVSPERLSLDLGYSWEVPRQARNVEERSGLACARAVGSALPRSRGRNGLAERGCECTPQLHLQAVALQGGVFHLQDRLC